MRGVPRRTTDDLFCFGADDRRRETSIYCFGCKREYPEAEYRSHRCPNPRSGEAYR